MLSYKVIELSRQDFALRSISYKLGQTQKSKFNDRPVETEWMHAAVPVQNMLAARKRYVWSKVQRMSCQLELYARDVLVEKITGNTSQNWSTQKEVCLPFIP